MKPIEDLAREAAEAASLPASLTAHPGVKDYVRRVAALVRADARQWQPIETAPKDGSWILLGYHLEAGGGGQPVVAMWHGRHLKWSDGTTLLSADGYYSPTHWMALPEPPGAAAIRALAVPME